MVDHSCWWKLTLVNVATCTGVLYVFDRWFHALQTVACTEDLQDVAALTSAHAWRDAICSVNGEQSGEHHEHMQYFFLNFVICSMTANISLLPCTKWFIHTQQFFSVAASSSMMISRRVIMIVCGNLRGLETFCLIQGTHCSNAQHYSAPIGQPKAFFKVVMPEKSIKLKTKKALNCVGSIKMSIKRGFSETC